MTVTPNCDKWTGFDPRDSSPFVDGTREAVFARLRQSETLPVSGNGPVPIYSLVRYEDVARAYKEPEVFSPCAGLTLDAFDPAACQEPSKMLEMAPTDRHRALRSVMLSAFRGKDLENFAATGRDLVDRFLTNSAGEDPVDFVDALARQVASTTTCELLGVGTAEVPRLEPALQALGSLDVETSSQSSAQRQKTELWLLRELTRVVRAHREQRRTSGLIEMLLAAEVDGNSLSDQEVVLNCLNVVVAGTGAMQHALAGAVAVWMEQAIDPDELGAEPERARRLIDETLRWLTPVVHLTRILTRDIEISGHRLPRGSGICLWNISANRDEELFEDATTFKPDRLPGRHLAFGAGPQHCLGAQLIRAQLVHLLTAIPEHGVRLERCGSPTWIRSNTITGVEKLPVRIRRNRAPRT